MKKYAVEKGDVIQVNTRRSKPGWTGEEGEFYALATVTGQTKTQIMVEWTDGQGKTQTDSIRRSDIISLRIRKERKH